jgi:hypothetical protein
LSNYTKTTDFSAKDALASGDANKVVSGTEIDAEFDAIQTSNNTKTNKSVPATTSNLAGLTSAGDLEDSGWLFSGTAGEVTANTADINKLTTLTATTAELNKLDGFTGDVDSLNNRATDYRGALVYMSAAESTATGVSEFLDFDSEDYDTSTIHDTVTNSSRLTVPTGVTRVRISGSVTFASNATGYRLAQIFKNNSASYTGFVANYETPVSGTLHVMSIVSPVLTVTATDYFELRVFQTSGGALDVNGGASGSWFAMEIIE